jgi:heat shock protein HslJ
MVATAAAVGSALLFPGVRASAAPLTGTTWTVVGLVDSRGAVQTPPPTPTPATLTIDRDGHVHGSTGCNAMAGSARVMSGGQEIEFGQLATTRRACAADAMALERDVLHALDGRVRVGPAGEVVTLRNEGNHTGLRLRAR